MLSISTDGYIRLSLAQIQAIELSHLITGLDEDAPTQHCTGAIHTAITGYTEWISAGSPALTLGWDWQMEAGQDLLCLKRVGAPRSNIMLLDGERRDLGHEASGRLLAALVDALVWQDHALHHIRHRYQSTSAATAG